MTSAPAKAEIPVSSPVSPELSQSVHALSREMIAIFTDYPGTGIAERINQFANENEENGQLLSRGNAIYEIRTEKADGEQQHLVGILKADDRESRVDFTRDILDTMQSTQGKPDNRQIIHLKLLYNALRDELGYLNQQRQADPASFNRNYFNSLSSSFDAIHALFRSSGFPALSALADSNEKAIDQTRIEILGGGEKRAVVEDETTITLRSALTREIGLRQQAEARATALQAQLEALQPKAGPEDRKRMAEAIINGQLPVEIANRVTRMKKEDVKPALQLLLNNMHPVSLRDLAINIQYKPLKTLLMEGGMPEPGNAFYALFVNTLLSHLKANHPSAPDSIFTIMKDFAQKKDPKSPKGEAFDLASHRLIDQFVRYAVETPKNNGNSSSSQN